MLALCLATLPLAAAAQDEKGRLENAATVDDLLQIYTASDNAITRARTLRALPRVAGLSGGQGLAKARAQGPTVQELERIYQMLDQGLGDQSVSVVKEAIRQIGKLGLSPYAQTLVDLFHRVDEFYPGSQKEIQSQIITALGKIGGIEADRLFREVLAQGVASYRSTRVLYAVHELGDPGLADAVAAYANYVEGLLAEMSEKGPRYEMYRQAYELARRVEKSLVE
jgi:hypothetical protein